MRLFTLLLLPLSLAFAPSAAAQTSPPREEHTGGLRQLVFETGGGTPEQPLPLIIALHYSGAEPEVLVDAFDDLRVPARVVLPEGPHPRPHGHSWFPQGIGQRPATEQAALTREGESRLFDFIQAVDARYPGRGKAIISGVSYGGDLSFLLALDHPDHFRAAFPVAARLLPEWLPARATCAADCPLLHAMHGSDDTTVPIGPTRAAVETLRARGYDATLAPYAGVAHDFSADMQSDLRARIEALLRAR